MEILSERIRAGAAVGKIVLPTVASTAPVLIRRKIVGKHPLSFQVYLLHSWPSRANEVARPFGKLAKARLTSTHAESGAEPYTGVCLERRGECVHFYSPMGALVPGQSAAYFPQHGKKNPKQPGESIPSPVYSVAYWDGCCQVLARQFNRILSDVALHAARKQQNLLSEGSWGYAWRV